MGHANLSNISDFFIKRLYAKGKLSIKECADALQEAGETLHASEGEYEDLYMLRHGLMDVVQFLRDEGKQWPIVIPHKDTTPTQHDILRQWEDGNMDDWDCGDDGNGGEYGIFDSIQWVFGPGWRQKYRDIPRLGNITH